MRWKNKYLVGISIGVALLLVDIAVFLDSSWFMPLFIIALSIGWLQVWLDFFMENHEKFVQNCKRCNIHKISELPEDIKKYIEDNYNNCKELENFGELGSCHFTSCALNLISNYFSLKLFCRRV